MTQVKIFKKSSGEDLSEKINLFIALKEIKDYQFIKLVTNKTGAMLVYDKSIEDPYMGWFGI